MEVRRGGEVWGRGVEGEVWRVSVEGEVWMVRCGG